MQKKVCGARPESKGRDHRGGNDRGLVEDVKDEVIEWCRHLHRPPELFCEEVETSGFIYETLGSFSSGLKLSRPTETSVVVRLVGLESGCKKIAIWVDLDALPIEEKNGFGFASENPGVMHACGHDGHTAILLGTAKVLGELKDHVRGEIRFVFLHTEEVGHRFPGRGREALSAASARRRRSPSACRRRPRAAGG